MLLILVEFDKSEGNISTDGETSEQACLEKSTLEIGGVSMQRQTCN